MSDRYAQYQALVEKLEEDRKRLDNEIGVLRGLLEGRPDRPVRGKGDQPGPKAAQAEVVRILEEGGWMTSDEIADKRGKTTRATRQALRLLTEKGTLEKRLRGPKGGRRTVWGIAGTDDAGLVRIRPRGDQAPSGGSEM